MTDPLDKQLVEVALSGGGRRKADLEEAKLAGVRTRHSAEDDLADDDLDEINPADETDDDGDTVEATDDDTVADPVVAGDAPVKLDPAAVDEPTAEELEALSVDMVEIEEASDFIELTTHA